MGFYVHRDGQNFGPFTLAQLREGLAAGNLLSTDFCRREDQAEWDTVATCLAPAKEPVSEKIAPARAVSNTPLYIGAAVIVIGLVTGWVVVNGDGESPKQPPGKTADQSGHNATAPANPSAGAPKDRGPRPLPANAKHIPVDALAVFTLRAADLLKKAGHERPIDIPLLADHQEAITEMSPFAAQFLRDPTSLGLNLAEPLHFFVQNLPPEGNASAGFSPLLGVVAAVDDANAVESGLTDLLEARLGGFGRQMMNAIKTENGWRILDTNRLPMAFAFSDTALVLVMRETPRPGESLAAPLAAAMRNNGGLPAAQPDFKRHLGEWMDAGLWWDTQRTRAVLAGDSDLRALVASLTEAHALATGVYFEKGAMSWFLNQQTTGDTPVLSNRGPADSLPALASSRAALAVGLSLNMTAARRHLATLPAKLGPQFNLTPAQFDGLLLTATGLKWAEWLALPDGGMVAALDGMRPAATGPRPRWLAGITVAEPALADRLLKHMADSGAKQDLARANLAILKSNNGLLCLATLDQQVAAQLGRVNDPVTGDRLALLRGHGMAGWIDAQRARDAAETLGAPPALLDALQPFKEAQFSGADTNGHTRLDLRLTLLNPDANSLFALLSLAGQLAELGKTTSPGSVAGPE